MFHLFQVNLVIYAAVAIAVLIFQLSTGTELGPASAAALRYGAVASSASLIMMLYGWRWVPFLGKFLFPNISGNWVGEIRYDDKGAPQQIDADLHVEQNLRSLSFVLTTERAESETLVVHPLKLSNGRYVTHYIYETRSKVGQSGPLYKYRGTAELRVEQNGKSLVGSYYTEQEKRGSVHFTRSPARWRWWKLETWFGNWAWFRKKKPAEGKVEVTPLMPAGQAEAGDREA